jgi:HEPN domain-containing protein
MGVPSTTQHWLDIASERAADAEAMLPQRYQSNGPVYMAGYAVECALNGLLHSKGIQRPRSNHGGKHHDLRRLWRVAGLKFRDLADPEGHKSWLLDSWGTHLRYDTENNIPIPSADIVHAAKLLTGHLHKMVRRQRGK